VNLPLERRGCLLVAPFEGEESTLDLPEIDEVGEHLALDDREVDFNLVQPRRVDRAVDESGGWVPALQAEDGCPAPVRRAVVHHPEHSPSRGVGLFSHSLGPPAGRRARSPCASRTGRTPLPSGRPSRPGTAAAHTFRPSCSTRITRASAGAAWGGTDTGPGWRSSRWPRSRTRPGAGALVLTDGRTGRGPGRPCYREKSLRVGCPPGRVGDGVRFCALRRASGQETWRERRHRGEPSHDEEARLATCCAACRGSLVLAHPRI